MTNENETEKSNKIRLLIQIVALSLLVLSLIARHCYLLYLHHFITLDTTDYIISLYYSFILGSLIEPLIFEFFCYTRTKLKEKNIIDNEDCFTT